MISAAWRNGRDLQSTKSSPLNPQLRRWTTPVKYPTFELKVPVGTGEQFQTRLADATPGDLNALKWYTVRSGDSLTTIARKLGVSRTDLAEANGLSTKARVSGGQELIIPRAPATLLAARTERAAPAVLASRPVSGAATMPDAPARTAEHDRLPRQARRHAFLDRRTVRYHGGQDQELE